jgi:hypothetical protein
MPKNLALLILFLSIAGYNYSQDSYIIKMNGDTARGSVRIREKVKNPMRVYYSQVEGTQEESFVPFQLKGFSDGADSYESAVVQIDNYSDGTPLANSPQFSFSPDSVFLKVLVKGPKSLFYLRDREGRDHFYIWNEKKYDLLLHKTYLKTDQDNKTFSVEVKTYINQLSAYFSDKPSIQKKIANTEFTYNKLVDLFNKYYSTTGTSPTKSGERLKTKFEVSLIAGMSNTKTSLSGGEFKITESNSASTDFTGGISGDLHLPGRLNLISLNNDLLYSSYDTRVKLRSNSSNYYATEESRIVASYIKLYTLARYRIRINPSSFIFLNAGISNGLPLDIKHTIARETVLNGEVITKSDENGISDDYTRKIEQGFLMGAGGKFRKFSLELRYEKSNGISSVSNFRSSNNRLMLLAGLTLF